MSSSESPRARAPFDECGADVDGCDVCAQASEAAGEDAVAASDIEDSLPRFYAQQRFSSGSDEHQMEVVAILRHSGVPGDGLLVPGFVGRGGQFTPGVVVSHLNTNWCECVVDPSNEASGTVASVTRSEARPGKLGGTDAVDADGLRGRWFLRQTILSRRVVLRPHRMNCR